MTSWVLFSLKSILGLYHESQYRDAIPYHDIEIFITMFQYIIYRTSLVVTNQTDLLSYSIHFLGRDLTLGLLPLRLAALIMRKFTRRVLP